jgi:hypothetical protein
VRMFHTKEASKVQTFLKKCNWANIEATNVALRQEWEWSRKATKQGQKEPLRLDVFAEISLCSFVGKFWTTDRCEWVRIFLAKW